jgi:hypothetical protein
MNIPDHISESIETIVGLKILKFFDTDPGSGMEKIGSELRINIPNPQHCQKLDQPFPFAGAVRFRTKS